MIGSSAQDTQNSSVLKGFNSADIPDQDKTDSFILCLGTEMAT